MKFRRRRDCVEWVTIDPVPKVQEDWLTARGIVARASLVAAEAAATAAHDAWVAAWDADRSSAAAVAAWDRYTANYKAYYAALVDAHGR